MGRLHGKTAIITGGASGIGRAAVLLFAREGAQVALGDIDDAGAAETLRQLQPGGGEVFFQRTDVSRAADTQALADAVMRRWGRIDILFNNAYWAVLARDVLTTTEDEWDRTHDVTLKSMYFMSRAVLPSMLAAGRGAIVNTASVAGVVGSRNLSAYAAAKGGVVALTKSMAQDFGKQGIRVNCIAPGPIDTPAIASLKTDPAWLSRQMGRLLLDRLGQPEDIAQAALYLASDEAAFVTGATLMVDGGATAR